MSGRSRLRLERGTGVELRKSKVGPLRGKVEWFALFSPGQA